MKNLILLLFVFISQNAASHEAHHLPLDLSFEEMREVYQGHLLKRKFKKSSRSQSLNPVLETTIKAGEKLNSWLNLINQNRTVPLRLTDASTQANSGIPITKPMKYSPKTIEESFNKLKTSMPKSLFDIFYGPKNITATLATDDETFKKWARKVSSLYQTTARWNMMSEWLTYYMGRRKSDVRGYYYLKEAQNIDYKIKNFNTLTSTEQSEITEALKGICYNQLVETELSCETKLNEAISKKSLLTFKKKYMGQAKKIWDGYFKISNPRTDVRWKKSSPNRMEVTFKDPRNTYIASWLKENIEDEFRWESWFLEMRFLSNANGISYMRFAPGVTPNVSEGNVITMDENASLEEFDVKWTIRHEYGHILRLPDCYTEFYDIKEGVMVNYQLDTTDLMCSRSGKMNKRIYEELKRVYLK